MDWKLLKLLRCPEGEHGCVRDSNMASSFMFCTPASVGVVSLSTQAWWELDGHLLLPPPPLALYMWFVNVPHGAMSCVFPQMCTSGRQLLLCEMHTQCAVYHQTPTTEDVPPLSDPSWWRFNDYRQDERRQWDGKWQQGKVGSKFITLS